MDSSTSDRVVVIAVDDSEDSQKAFNWAISNIYREGDQVHIVHVVPRLAFAAQYGVPPVDFVPAAESNTYETAVQRAEQFIIDRFVKAMPPSVRAPVVHIIKVGGCCSSWSGIAQSAQ
jgi:nucleotide-binding universal stress UspA family protein